MAKNRYIFLIILMIFTLIAVFPAGATPPNNIDLIYNYYTGILDVVISHQVNDPKDHFIKQVIIQVGEKQILNENYPDQPELNTFTYHYPIPIGREDAVQVKATCNKYGSLSQNLKPLVNKTTNLVSQNSSTGTSSSGPTITLTSSSPGFTVFGALFAFFCLFIFLSTWR